MAEKPTGRRGRPKGSGIDDAQTLQRITALMAGDTSLRPTTAIHRAGVSDPSVVRRLREKLKAQAIYSPLAAGKRAAPGAQKNAPAEARPARSAALKITDSLAPQTLPPPAAAPVAPPAGDRTEAQKREAELLATYMAALAAPAKPAEPPVGYPEPAPASERSSPRPQAPAPNSPQLPGIPNPALEGMRLAIEAAVAVSRLQLFLMGGALKGTPWATMLQGQAMMGQMMLAAFTGAIGRMGSQPPTEKK